MVMNSNNNSATNGAKGLPMTSYPHLLSGCGARCTSSNCAEAVKLNAQTGRFFITMGHAGFNLPANNGRGYATREAAKRAHLRCNGR